MKVRLHPQAEQDLLAAADFHAREGSPAVARRYLRDFERVTALLAERPDIGTPRSRGRRGLAMSKFPFTVVYRIMGGEIIILVVKHNRRRPGYGAGRS